MSECGDRFRHVRAGGCAEAAGNSVIRELGEAVLTYRFEIRTRDTCGMQRIYRSPWSPEEYEQQGKQRKAAGSGWLFS